MTGNHPHTELGELAVNARKRLELERSFGIEEAPYHPERVDEHRKAIAARVRERADRAREAAASNKTSELEALRQELESCQACGLGEGRTKLVFGAGNPDANILFVGEAPGYHEDQQGIPFVGKAGQLLTKIIEAMGLTRDEIYIGNVCKCRPPNNRTPAPNESATCFPFLLKQIEIIQPKVIVTMGNPATKAVLQTTQGITSMRGRFHEWQGMAVMPTFHPSYLLRNPSAKRQVWEDMQQVWSKMKELGLPIGELKRGRGR